MNTLKKIAAIFFRVGISIFILVFLFRQVDGKALFELIKTADKRYLFFAFVFFFGTYILGILRWQMLLRAVRIRLPLRRIVMSFSGGIFFNLFLPSSIGGDFVRSMDLAAHTKRPNEVVATVFLDRLSGYLGLVLLSLISLLSAWPLVRDPTVFLSIGAITLILCVILTVLFNKWLYDRIKGFLRMPNAGKIKEIIANLHREIHYFKQHKKIMICNLALSLIIQTISPLTFYLIGLSLGIKINIVYFFIFLPIIGAVTLLPISIGGLGLREKMTIDFFAKAGVLGDSAFAMSLISSFFIFVYGAIGGIIYVLAIRHRRIQHHKPSSI